MNAKTPPSDDALDRICEILGAMRELREANQRLKAVLESGLIDDLRRARDAADWRDGEFQRLKKKLVAANCIVFCEQDSTDAPGE